MKMKQKKTVWQTETTKIKWRSRQNNCIKIWEKQNNNNGNETIVLASAKRLITFHLEWLVAYYLLMLLLLLLLFAVSFCLFVYVLLYLYCTSFTFVGPLHMNVSLSHAYVHNVYTLLYTQGTVHTYLCTYTIYSSRRRIHSSICGV